MNRSFYNGVIGIKTHQFGMDVWANNIANMNSIGFKYSTPEFKTIFSQQMGLDNYEASSTNDVGLGAFEVAAAPNFSMGSLIQTDSQFDMALSKKGFFGLLGADGGVLYTRNGSFLKDASGNLVDSQGHFVLGKFANNISDGIITDDSVGDISINGLEEAGKINLPKELLLPAKPTTYVNMKGNLDATPTYVYNENGEKVEKPNVEVYKTDLFTSSGDRNFLKITFTKVVPQTDVKIYWDAKAVVTDKDGNIIDEKDGVLTFNEDGTFLSSTLTSINNGDTKVALNFGTPFDPNNPFSGWDGMVSYNDSDLDGKMITKDGYEEGHLDDYAIDSNGNIQAVFDNGKSISIYKIMVFNFINEQGLNQVAPGYFEASPNSGDAFLLKDANGNYVGNNIVTGHLETSNVDMGVAMTELIVMQKAYEANAKSITTSDQLIQNAINMKK